MGHIPGDVGYIWGGTGENPSTGLSVKRDFMTLCDERTESNSVKYFYLYSCSKAISYINGYRVTRAIHT